MQTIGLEHENIDYDVTEHGRQWAICRTCGAQWAIHKSNLGDDFECVADGDGYCGEHAQ